MDVNILIFDDPNDLLYRYSSDKLYYYIFSLNANLKDIDTGALLQNYAGGPSEEYENLRRRIYSNTKEIWYFINHELTKLKTADNKEDKVQAILVQVAHRKR